MFDTVLRRHLAGPLDRVAALLDRAWITPDRLTLLGLVVGLTSAVTAAGQLWLWSLACWLASRVLDGLDGPLARRRAAAARADRSGSSAPVGSEAGGFLDITADFTVYGATVVGVAVGTAAAAGPEHTWGSWLPFLAVLLAYYVNGTAFLAFSSIAERTGHRLDDGRSFSFLAGLTEGAETVAGALALAAAARRRAPDRLGLGRAGGPERGPADRRRLPHAARRAAAPDLDLTTRPDHPA